MLGDSALSTATSLKDKWTLGLYLFSSSTVVSPDQQKKNMTKEAAHSIIELKDWSLSSQLCRIYLRIIGVIGNWALGAFSSFTRFLSFPNWQMRCLDDLIIPISTALN